MYHHIITQGFYEMEKLKNSMKKIKITKASLKEFFLITVGALMAASGVIFFKAPNNFVTGGVSGVAIIIRAIFPNFASVGIMVMVLNVALLLLGFLFLGKKLGAKTVYCTLLFSVFNLLIDEFCPITQPITVSEIRPHGDPTFEMLCGAALSSIGGAILFNNAASTGGTDILTMIVKKYTRFNISISMLCIEFAVAFASGFVKTIGWSTAGYGIVTLLIQVIVINVVTENLNHKKQITIITTNPRPICQYINNELHRGATVVRGLGAYTGDVRYMIYTVVSARQAVEVKKRALEFDTNGFVIINNTTDIIGKGFRRAALDFADDDSIVRIKDSKHHHVAKPTVICHDVPDYDIATLVSLGILPSGYCANQAASADVACTEETPTPLEQLAHDNQPTPLEEMAADTAAVADSTEE